MRRNQSEESFLIKGWQDNQESTHYLSICQHPCPQPSWQLSKRHVETSHQHIPFKKHRRNNTKPLSISKYFEPSSLQLQKDLLCYYLNRQSQRNSSAHRASNVTEELCAALPEREDEQAQAGITLDSVKQNKKEDNMKADIFSCLKLEKKNRRKFHIKSKILDEVEKTSMDKRRQRMKPSTGLLTLPYNESHQEHKSRTRQSLSRKFSLAKTQKFPVYFREVQLKQQEEQKKISKLRECYKKQKKKNGSHFHLAKRSKGWTNCLEFTDDNIFPMKIRN